MNSADKNQLIVIFEELYATEQMARDLYNSILENLQDKNSNYFAVIEKIRDQEVHHMQNAQEIITIIKNQN